MGGEVSMRCPVCDRTRDPRSLCPACDFDREMKRLGRLIAEVRDAVDAQTAYLKSDEEQSMMRKVDRMVLAAVAISLGAWLVFAIVKWTGS